MKNTGAPIRDFDRQIHLFTKFSLRNSSSSFCSGGERGNVLPLGSLASGWSSIAWSHDLRGGGGLKSSSEKTAVKSLEHSGIPLPDRWACWAGSSSSTRIHVAVLPTTCLSN